ncbi:hypothetical protein H7J87_11655 [Mycolicibacterium wolinskyi]|uniref:Uncharacterized protein n=1 Tax=Mycolicibacterium wolinskyi TaxID=59750 RepID=A0A1X2FJ58_9MYCO|nr:MULTISPECIES: hypothetical protein [Mycolicibacterium]MCV7285985.1 hypothetical protein [Mycolicibacterium wolinskyi]MCV7296181.1 hypothetical protein [Mycolicibacterium goodii]ORX18417.1 hypothetical protein AWC31_14020 [Mycolicibacterium wolinskyi]
MTMLELVELREAATAQAGEHGADESHVAYHQGAADAVRSVLFVVAAGEVVTIADIEDRLAKLRIRIQQPWSMRYCAYWEGAAWSLKHILGRWKTSAAQER